MDFKITLKCEACRCSFELRPKKFKRREEMFCPNCGAQMPDDMLQHINSGIENLGEISTPDPFNFQKPQFSASIGTFSDFQDLCVDD